MSKPKKQRKIRYDKQVKDKPKSATPKVPPGARNQGKVTASPPTAAAPSLVVSLEPLAPLIVRSGRPFDDQAGADTARFPPPSTIAGCLRTAWAREHGADFDASLARLSVHAPLLVRPTAADGIRWLAPKPADALYFGYGETARCIRAAPAAFESGCDADLPADLRPLRLSESVQGKPGTGPAWWDWQDLIAFRGGAAPDHAALDRGGWSPPPGERRTHVAIDPKTRAARAGQLFQTEGLDFEQNNHGLCMQAVPSTLRLLVRCGEPLGAAVVHLGGERRLAQLQPQPLTLWPEPPAGWFARIVAAGGLTLTVLTPAAFTQGWRPGWLDAALTGEPPGAPGLRLKLRAAALARWQPHSGWDLARNEPRQSRKLVPAGATYWFDLLGSPKPETLALLWLASLSDSEQDRRDGYALALPAPWNPID